MSVEEALKLKPILPHLDREVLLSSILKKERAFLLAHNDLLLTALQLKRYQVALARTEKYEPIAYIIGEKEFYGRKFLVGPGILIPRPETEILVELLLKNISDTDIQKEKKYAVVDIGTGSGAIVTSLFISLQSSKREKISWYAVDTEKTALRYARKNAKRHGVEKRIQFIESDLLNALTQTLKTFDEVFIVANLPYLSKALYQATAPNVKLHEPKSALESGQDGLDHYRRLWKELHALSIAGVKVYFSFEISPEQTASLQSLVARHALPGSVTVTKDYAHKERIVSGTIAPIT